MTGAELRKKKKEEKKAKKKKAKKTADVPAVPMPTAPTTVESSDSEGSEMDSPKKGGNGERAARVDFTAKKAVSGFSSSSGDDQTNQFTSALPEMGINQTSSSGTRVMGRTQLNLFLNGLTEEEAEA